MQDCLPIIARSVVSLAEAVSSNLVSQRSGWSLSVAMSPLDWRPGRDPHRETSPTTSTRASTVGVVFERWWAIDIKELGVLYAGI